MSREMLAICVPSYRRPSGLHLLLRALDDLVFDVPPPEIRIVVVDNDPDESARPVVEDARSWLRWPIQYVLEKRVGIPQARNAALAVALSSDWVAFVDDDEIPEPRWLDALFRTQRETAADVVTGPSLPRFVVSPPDWVIQGRFFEPVRYATGTALSTAFTNNVLARMSALQALGSFFDEGFTLGVGEDTELFGRVASAGGHIVWADDAIVHEHVPPARATLRWILARGYRVGATSAAASSRGAAYIVANAVWCLMRGLGEAGWGVFRDPALCVRGLRLAAYGLGRSAGVCGLR